jgi:type I restriction enzyme S subunit
MDFCIAQDMVAVRADPQKIYPKYLFAALRSSLVQAQISNMHVGTMIPHFKKGDFDKLKIPVPERSDQHTIGDFYFSISERVTLLQETNATLESIAQALFKSWFIDFDPVHAKQQGLTPEGMDEATAALFPDNFDESKQGMVPRGWHIGALVDLSTLNPESWTARKHPDTVAYIDLANTKNNEITEITDYQFTEAPSRARRVLRHGDTIVGTVRPGNRSFAFISNPIENLTGSTGFAVLRPEHPQNAEFLYLAATQESSIEHLAHVADGGAYPAVRADVVASIRCSLPSDNIMSAFHDLAEPLFMRIAENQSQAKTLSALRDTLLPRLISGQLRLPEAEELLESA